MCTIVILTDEVDEESGLSIIFRIPHLSKKDDRHFVSVVTTFIEEHKNMATYRTETCPQYDEVVKWKARGRKYCGH